MKKWLVGLLSLLCSVGLTACGTDGKTPYIGDNGNWWIGETDTGVPAGCQTCKDGVDGKDGTDGKDGVDGKDGTDGKDDVDGKDGKDGKNITVVSVEKTDTNGLVDTYTITFSDGTTATFTVTNGESNVIESIELTNSTGLVDTYTITFTNGSTKTFTVTNGKDGKNLTILSIELKSSEGLIDTYVITYSDGSKFEFVVSNGADGLTPHIGDNGNWWIGETDTGVLADGEKANNVPLTPYSDGLVYTTRTVAGKTGFVVEGWNIELIEETLVAQYTEEECEKMYSTSALENAHLVIPNYIGSVPVIGIELPKTITPSNKLNFGKITLSRNTVYLGKDTFNSCNYVKEIDFNNSNLKTIPANCFKGTSIDRIDIPSSVTRVYDSAFSGVMMNSFDFSNIKYIGSNAFDSITDDYVYLSKNVDYVGNKAFDSTRVYIEHEVYPSSWDANIVSNDEIRKKVSVNCKRNENYMYSCEEDGVTIYQYLGNEKKIKIPSVIEGKNVTKIGYGFNTPSQYKSIELESFEQINDYIHLEEVVLPEGVKEIDDYALCGLGTTIFAPKSLERISETLYEEIYDGEYAEQISLNGKEIEAITTCLMLSSENMPIVFDSTDHGKTETISDEIIRRYKFYFGIDFTKVENDDKFYYLNDGNSYSIISYKGLKGTSLIVPSSFNGKPVTTISKSAISYDSTLQEIKIENGISRIRPYGCCGYYAKSIQIPNSVAIINENGVFVSSKTTIFVAASSKPVDWDSKWTNELEQVKWGINGEVETNNFFTYVVNTDNSISLFQYNGTSSNILIPKEIDGKTVKSIQQGFYTYGRGAKILIPATIQTIEANSFVNSSSNNFQIYCEDASKKDGWDSNWYYNSYRRDNTSYVSKQWGQTNLFDYKYNDEYVYSVGENGVILHAYAGETSIIKVPRKIENQSIYTIEGYCYYIDKWNSRVYIPSDVNAIEAYAFEVNLSGTYTYFYCEPQSKPSSWNSYFAYDTYRGSSSYISITYESTLDY